MSESVLSATQEKVPRQIGGKQIWSHFGFLLGLAAILYVVVRVFAGTGLAGTLSGLPQFMFVVIPIAAGLAAGATSFSPASLRGALGIALVAPVLMLLFESGIGPRLAPAVAEGVELEADLGTEVELVNRSGSLSIFVDMVSDPEFRQSTAPAERYGFGHPRLLLKEAATRILALLLPGVLIGLAIGIASWMNTRVRFITAVDARFAQLLVAWTVIPLARAVIDYWAVAMGFSALFEGVPLWILLVPYLAFGLLAALGWRSASRVSNQLES